MIDERRDPARSFAGHTRQMPWDNFHVIYFASEVNWNYFVAPFIFARSDFITAEIEPWHEDGHVWRSLLVTYPYSIVAHCRQQTYYFDHTGPEGGWGIAGIANTGADIAAAARAELTANKAASG